MHNTQKQEAELIPHEVIPCETVCTSQLLDDILRRMQIVRQLNVDDSEK